MMPTVTTVWAARPGACLQAGHPASRLAASLLLIITAMAASAPVLAALSLLVVVGLTAGGLIWSRVPRLLLPWLGLGLVVLTIHTLTATDVAPLGEPTGTGLVRGLVVLWRLAVVLAVVAVAGRTLPLEDLIVALAWWLRPWRRFGVSATNVGLAIAVALGTASGVRDESRRLLACQRLRRPPGRLTPWRWLRLRLRVVPPLVDTLIRRSESLPLVVAWRLPVEEPVAIAPAWPELGLLLGWTAALVWLA